jgi:tetratricopeptide (TPR) repeat protein
MDGTVFISHTSKDDEFVKSLREKLEAQKILLWVDSRKLRGGDKLNPEIHKAIEEARAFIVVISESTFDSDWVRLEIEAAVKTEKRRKDDGYRVIPLLLGVSEKRLRWIFKDEPVGVMVKVGPGGLDEAIIPLLEALGERLPSDHARIEAVAAPPVDELVLRLEDPHMQEKGGLSRAAATAILTYHPAGEGTRSVESQRFTFTAPLGAIEHDEIRWYLEEYHRWPVGVFRQRAGRTEAQLPEWGQALYRAALGVEAAQNALTGWRSAAGRADRRITIEVDADLPEDASKKKKAAAQEAASALLALPWELLHDGTSYLFKGGHPVRVRRRLPNRNTMERALAKLPIRILVVSPRPEDGHAAYIDHRLSARALTAAVENLGDLAELTVLTPPTFPALDQALEDAVKENDPYEVIHFDGHGVYDPYKGLGALVFEEPNDTSKLIDRRSQMIDAKEFANLVRNYRIPLVFLDACQGAKFDQDPTASVAAQLLEAGVTSVVAMTHSVLVETARRFTQAFYKSLAEGGLVGQAMLAGQKALEKDTYRGVLMGAGELRLQDWFVPVLYQEEHDPQLFDRVPDEEIKRLHARTRKLRLGALPEPPKHTFIGRGRELLALERLLLRSDKDDPQYAVILGQGGVGKTTIAVELARWLAQTDRFERVAFVSLEFTHDARALLDTLGRQVLPEGDKYSVAQYKTLDEARQPVDRVLREQSVLLVVDNVETILPSPNVGGGAGGEDHKEIFALLTSLLSASPTTRLLLTSREALPASFERGAQYWSLGVLSQRDAVDLVSHVLTAEGAAPPAADPGQTPEEVTALVEAVGCHARALVLIARIVSQNGVRLTTENLHELMAELERQHPGERENSLYASVELSLRRLTEDDRRKIAFLGAFHGGVNLGALVMMLEGDEQTAVRIAKSLIEVGLAQPDEYTYLQLDPTLPPYLWSRMAAEEQTTARAHWGQAMHALINFLQDQRFEDTKLAARLTLLELPNLLAALTWAEDSLPPEEAAGLAGSIEQLLAALDRPRALELAVAARERLSTKLGEWSHARFEHERLSVGRLLAEGNLPAALQAAQSLLQRSLAAGEKAYPDADYDIAGAYWWLGRVLSSGGAAEAALEPLSEAQRRFESLAAGGNESAARMSSAAITEQADCLQALGRLDDAVIAYQKAITFDEKRGGLRDVAVGKGQLGTVRMLQQRHAEALEAHAEARSIFEGLGEPEGVATAWHQTGMVHRRVRNYPEAERAYRQSLAIEVGRGNRRGQASSLGELGNLSNAMGRLEEAVTFYRQAADIAVVLNDLSNEGKDRNNIANILIKLQRYDEARQELLRAIECKMPYGHAAEPWKTWNTLHNLEQAVGNPSAAAEARQKAVETYLAYRRD